MIKKTSIACLLTLLATSTLQADTIELNNGKTLEGSFIGRDGDVIQVDVDGITMSLNAADVKNIHLGSAAAPTEKTTQAKTHNSAKPTGEIAAGTVMTIRLNDTLDTGKHSTGHKFSGVIEGALIDNGKTAVPAGSKVYGIISESVKARRVAGKAKMMLTITQVNINGELVTLKTSAVNAQTTATGKTSAGRVARGAAIGGLADGSSGAKTGAKVGVGVAVLSGGNQVVIPSGTLLDFQLAQALKY